MLQSDRLATAITDTVNRYWAGCMSRPTFRDHLRSLWGQVKAAGLAEPVTARLEAGILNALERNR